MAPEIQCRMQVPHLDLAVGDDDDGKEDDDDNDDDDDGEAQIQNRMGAVENE